MVRFWILYMVTSIAISMSTLYQRLCVRIFVVTEPGFRPRLYRPPLGRDFLAHFLVTIHESGGELQYTGHS